MFLLANFITPYTEERIRANDRPRTRGLLSENISVKK